MHTPRMAPWLTLPLLFGIPHLAAAADSTTHQTTIRVVDDVTSAPLADVTLVVDGKSYPVDQQGTAQVEFTAGQATVSAAYTDGKIRRVETLHGVPAQKDVTLRVPNQQAVRREAVFSVGVPFGPIQREAKALLLLPQPAYESGGLNFGHYDQVRIYQDQLQNDGRFSLMVVALDENLVPWKFGYMLDASPTELDEAHVMFKPPQATGIDRERQLVRWKKLADPLNASDATSTCDFKSPPFTDCGLYPDKGGIFSWINVWRKGQLFHTPGAFLPSRTEGANPLLALPNGQMELVGHDDPKGFSPFNYARHRFLRFDTPPANQIDILMPNVLIGAPDKPGADAIAVDGSGHGARFTVQAAGSSAADVDNLDMGKLQMIWTSPDDGVRTIWNQYFAPQPGENAVTLPSAPESLASWLPRPQQKQFENVQVWLMGSDGVKGYAEALGFLMQGNDPLRQGASAFRVTRWR